MEPQFILPHLFGVQLAQQGYEFVPSHPDGDSRIDDNLFAIYPNRPNVRLLFGRRTVHAYAKAPVGEFLRLWPPPFRKAGPSLFFGELLVFPKQHSQGSPLLWS